MDMRCVHSDTKPVAALRAAVTEPGGLCAGAHNDAAAVLIPRELCDGTACNAEWGAGGPAAPMSDRTAAAACVATSPLLCLKRDMMESVFAAPALWQLLLEAEFPVGELAAALSTYQLRPLPVCSMHQIAARLLAVVRSQRGRRRLLKNSLCQHAAIILNEESVNAVNHSARLDARCHVLTCIV